MNDLLRAILNLPPQASSVAKNIDFLHYFVISVTMLGAMAVSVLAAYFVVRYRRSARRGAVEPDTRAGHTAGGLPIALELVLIGGLLGLFVMWWVIGFRQYVELRTPPEGTIDVYVVGKQWMWSFAYPDGTSSNAILYVPAGQPVKLIMSSRDVIHSFYVPAFRIKQDVVPGHTTTTWFEATEPGVYDLLCAEYCGTDHSTMRGRVVVLSPADYDRQLHRAAAPSIAGPSDEEPSVFGRLPETSLSLAEMGERVAATHGCLRCHTVDGTPHIGPTWARMIGSTVRLDNGETIVADEAYLTASMMDPLAMIHEGYPPVMPSYRGLLTAAETGALLEYMKGLRDVDVERARVDSPLPLGPSTVELPTAGEGAGGAGTQTNDETGEGSQ